MTHKVGAKRRAQDIKALRGIWAGTHGAGTKELLEDRRRERELEDRKAPRRDVGGRLGGCKGGKATQNE